MTLADIYTCFAIRNMEADAYKEMREE